MAHEKTWQFAMNQQFGDVSSAENQGDWFLWFVKQALVGHISLTDQAGAAIASPAALWTLRGSSDGVTAGLDGVDRWGSGFDASKVVHAPAGSAHSWVCLTSAALGIDLILDCASSGVGTVMLIFCAAAPTGGSATARPTSTDEIPGYTGGYSFMDTVTGAPRKAHFMLATDGSFFALHSQDTTGLVKGSLLVHKIADLDTGDSYPFIGMAETATNGVFRSAAFLGNTSVGLFFRDVTGANRTTGSALVPYVCGQSLLTLSGARPPNINGRLLRFPALVGDAGSGKVKGRCQDWFLAPASAADTDLLPSTGSPTDWHIGGCVLPTNTVPSL